MAKKQAKKKQVKKKLSTAEKIIESAIIWHAATVLTCQDETDSKADKYLRRAVMKHLKADKGTRPMEITVVEL